MTKRRYPARCEFDNELDYLRACERVDMENLDHLVVVLMPVAPQPNYKNRIVLTLFAATSLLFLTLLVYSYVKYH